MHSSEEGSEKRTVDINMTKKQVIRMSVRNLVEFILRSGDIDNRHFMTPENAMLEGGRIHRMIQRRMGSNYTAEVSLRYLAEYEEYIVSIEGRADGVLKEKEYRDTLIRNASQLSFLEGSASPGEDAKDDKTVSAEVLAGLEQEYMDVVTIDEIKGTYSDIKRMKGPVAMHLAQAKCYAYIYALNNKLGFIRVRMTYCHLESEQIRYFYEEYAFAELEEWFLQLLAEYKKWTDFEISWKQKRQGSIKLLQFPFSYREGQKELVEHVYRTIYHKKKLFMVAPTGVGKTISTLFPAIQAIGREMGNKLFYLTAKTITRTVADDSFEILRRSGLQMKTIILTAREKICPLEETECNPAACSYARGHYDRINNAVYELLTSEDRFTRERIEEYAKKHQVCPFELGLDMSLFADGIICDYNYVFDPHAYLRRFFGDGIEGDYIFLIDEAHNLLERGREMYSARLCKEDFLDFKSLTEPIDSGLDRYFESCNREMLALKRDCGEFKVVEQIAPFVNALNRLYSAIEKSMLENKAWSYAENLLSNRNVRKTILEFYFEISHFLDIYERIDDNYVIYAELKSGVKTLLSQEIDLEDRFILKLFCVNPAVNLQECLAKARSTILFSATLIPVQYYKALLGGNSSDFEVYVRSSFRAEKRGMFIGTDVTSRYSRRTEEEYINVAAYIHEIVKNRHGNYMIFFPSHTFLQRVYQIFTEYFQGEDLECIIQSDTMSETEREEFLQCFTGNEEYKLDQIIHMDIEIEDRSLIGFCILGGIFSEGIDLTEDRLIGAVIVGTGIPQVCHERELLKAYFDEKGENGFDYAYRFPGMNKVMQAAGRVIRTARDVGIVALLDDRFLQNSYQNLFPPEWKQFEAVTRERISGRIERFWNEWL